MKLKNQVDLTQNSEQTWAPAQLFITLGINKSHSRPHISDDNPYSESQFKVLKYRPDFSDRFGCIEDALTFCRSFFTWYNTEHHHSGIGILIPEVVHYGLAQEIIKSRKVVLEEAYGKHPERFVRGVPFLPVVTRRGMDQSPEKNNPLNTGGIYSNFFWSVYNCC